MPPIMYPKDNVHDFLFYETVADAHQRGILMDFHVRDATSQEMEKAFEAYLDDVCKEQVELPYAIIDGEPDHRWRHTSNFQKAIRRSDLGQALMSSHWLIDNGFEDQFWKRLAVVIAEDVAFGHPYLTALVLFATRHKRIRNKCGPRLLDWIMKEACNPLIPKSRDLTDLFIWSIPKNGQVHIEYEIMQNKLENGAYTAEDIKHFALGDEGASMPIRMAALWCYYPRFLIVDGLIAAPALSSVERKDMLDAWGMPGLIQYIFHWGNSATGFGLGVPAPIVWERMCAANSIESGVDPYYPSQLGLPIEPAFEKLHGIYAASFDMHNRDGKRAIAYFRKASDAVKKADVQSVANPRGAITEAVFYAETGLLVPRLMYDGFKEPFQMCRDGYFAQYGVKPGDADKLIKLVASELPTLNKSRKVVVE